MNGSALRRVAAIAALGLTMSRTTSAQTSANFGLCVFGGFDACTDLFLSTTPNGAGTLVDVLVRQRSLGGPSVGLLAFGFGFPTSATFDATPLVPTLVAANGAPPVTTPVAWTARGLGDAIAFMEGSSPGPLNPAPVQYVAACGGGSFAGALAITSLVTCGGGAYAFHFATNAVFDAHALTGLTIDLYAGLLDPAGAPTVVSCAIDVAGAGACLDFTNLVDPIVPFTLGAPATLAPEPTSLALLATALGVIAIRRRRAVVEL